MRIELGGANCSALPGRRGRGCWGGGVALCASPTRADLSLPSAPREKNILFHCVSLSGLPCRCVKVGGQVNIEFSA